MEDDSNGSNDSASSFEDEPVDLTLEREYSEINLQLKSYFIRRLPGKPTHLIFWAQDVHDESYIAVVVRSLPHLHSTKSTGKPTPTRSTG